MKRAASAASCSWRRRPRSRRRTTRRLMPRRWRRRPPRSQRPPSHRSQLHAPSRWPTACAVILHEDHTRAARHREHVVPRRLGARAPRPHRLRASLRAPDVHGIGPRQAGRVRRAGSKRAGGDNNGSTENDRTNYYDQRAVERARARAVPRIGSHGLSARHDDARRSSTRSATSSRTSGARATRTVPTAWRRSTLGEMLYPEGHPYHWPVIGYMADLTAASYDDVVAVLQEATTRRRTPASSSPAISTRRRRDSWSRSGSATSKPAPPPEPIADPRRRADRRARRKRSPIACSCRGSISPGSRRAHFAPGDAALDVVADVLAGGKNSRLYKRLVYDMQIAQDVSAFQQSQALVVGRSRSR